MDKMLNVRTFEIYKCGIVTDSESGMNYSDDIELTKDGKIFKMSIYASLLNGELIDVVTGMRIKYVGQKFPYGYDYSLRTYDDLKKLTSGYYYVYSVEYANQNEVANKLVEMEENDLIPEYAKRLNCEYEKQQSEINKYLDIRKKSIAGALSEDKVLSK